MRSLAVGTVAVALLAFAPTAQAESWHGRDARHDVAGFTHTAEPAPCGTTTDFTDPRDELRDIKSLDVDHERDRITITLRMRDVHRRGPTYWSFHLRTPSAAYELGVIPGRAGEKLFTDLSKEPHFGPPNECGESGAFSAAGLCQDLHAHLDVRAEAVAVELPRSCLKDPRWVQVGVDVSGFTGSPSDFTIRYDRWAPAGVVDTGYPPPYGPRVRPG